MRQSFLLIVSFLFITLAISSCTKKTEDDKNIRSSSSSDKDSSLKENHEDPVGYYTCPMHPQVHEHQSGKCPICGMALVKVSGDNKKPQLEAADRNEMVVSDRQLQLAGISKYTVIRKDLTFTIPVGGRWLSSQEIAFQVYESDLKKIRIGSDFIGSSGSTGEEKFLGKIRSIDNLIDPSSRTVRVIGALQKPAKGVILDSGFFGEIRSTEKSQLAIPEQAVLHMGTRDFIYLIGADNKLKPVPVTLGEKAEGEEYQILSGLKEGDVISSGPNFLIDSEAKIRGLHD